MSGESSSIAWTFAFKSSTPFNRMSLSRAEILCGSPFVPGKLYCRITLRRNAFSSSIPVILIEFAMFYLLSGPFGNRSQSGYLSDQGRA